MSGFVSTPETEFCGVCQRERVSCAHLDGEVATDGGEPVQESEPLEAVERVKDVHPNLLGLASAASTGDVENAEEHIAELRDALDDIEDLVLDGEGNGENSETPHDLVEKWREEASGLVSWEDYGDGIHDALRACADELEDALEESDARGER